MPTAAVRLNKKQKEKSRCSWVKWKQMARAELGISDTSGTIDTIDTIDTTLDQSEGRIRPIRRGQKRVK